MCNANNGKICSVYNLMRAVDQKLDNQLEWPIFSFNLHKNFAWKDQRKMYLDNHSPGGAGVLVDLLVSRIH